MSTPHDPELDDVLQDVELLRIARILSATRQSVPPADDAFRSGLRHNLMNQADLMVVRRAPWWRPRLGPPVLAWAGAAAGLVLIASVVVYTQLTPPSSVGQLIVTSPIDGSQTVQVQQPIKVSFNQPMNHAAVEAAVQVSPATNVTFSWQDNTLYVTPQNGTLAPNTQYQVTIGSTATTAQGAALEQAQTITFVTQPQTSPSPTPAPRPSPANLVTGEKQLAPLGGTATGQVQWTADSTSIFFVTSAGALQTVPAKGGDVTVIAPDGVSSVAIAPAGDRLAYVRGGKLETLSIASGTTAEMVPSPPAVVVGWSKDGLVWSAGDGFYAQGAKGPIRLAALPTSGTVTVSSIAPDGAHAAYTQDQKLWLVDLSSGKSTGLGSDGATFVGWSPSGSLVMYSSGGGIAIADLGGNLIETLPAGAPSWSAQGVILLGGDTTLSQLPADGSTVIKLADGTYQSPAVAPDGTTFAFVRGAALWVASAPPLPAQPNALDQAKAVVGAFMQARLDNKPDQASALLDGSGKQAYASGGLRLTISGDPTFTRYYILTQELTATQPDSAQFVVRLVLSHGKIDVSDVEETLTLVRDPTTNQFVIDQATSGAHRDLGKGAEVVGVDVGPSTIKVSFDSDLDPSTIASGVYILDSHGKKVVAKVEYREKKVTISGLELEPGAQYTLVVSTSVRDVLGHGVASEYELVIVGPAPDSHESSSGGGTTGPRASPSAAASPPAQG